MHLLEHYVRPPKHTLPQILSAIAGFAVLAVLLTAQGMKARETAAQAEAGAEQLRRSNIVRPVEKKSAAMMEVEKKWASLSDERDFDWAGVFAAVERAGSSNVELLQFKPDKGNRQVMLGGEARDLESLMKFLDRLSAQPTLANVHLTHQQRKSRERLNTVAFEVRARIVD